MDGTNQLDAERAVQAVVLLGASITRLSINNITMNPPSASLRSAVAGYRERWASRSGSVLVVLNDSKRRRCRRGQLTREGWR